MRTITAFAAVLLILLSCYAQQRELDNLNLKNITQNKQELPLDEKQAKILKQPTGILTLEKAVAAILLGNPKLKAFALDQRIAEAMEITASSKPNPEFEIEVENFGGTGESSSFNAAETTFALSRVIELGGKLEKRKKIADVETQLAKIEYQNAKFEIITDFAVAFIDAAAMQKRIEMLEELIQLSQDVYNKISIQAESGKGTATDAAKAKIELSDIELEYKQALRDYEQAKKYLASFWGSQEAIFDKIIADLTISQSPDFDKLKLLVNNNPRLRQIKAIIEKNKVAVEIEKANSIPDITLSGGVKIDNHSNEKTFVVGIAIELPISQTNRGQRLAANYNLAKSYELKRQEQLEIQNAFNSLQTDITNSLTAAKELSNNILPQAKKILEATQQAYSQGKISYLEVLDAQRQYIQKKGEYIEITARYHKSIALIEGITGETINTSNSN